MSIKRQCVINKANTKRFLLQVASEIRAKKFQRVSKELLDHLEIKLQNLCIDVVQRHPSVGVTLYPLERNLRIPRLL